MALFIFIIIILAIVIFLAEAGILLWVEKLFKIENSTYKSSLKILAFLVIISIVVEIIAGIIGLDFLSDALVIVLLFFVLHYFLKKHYQSSWKKSLGIYAVFGIVGIIVSLFIIIPARLYLFSPFTVAGEAMSPAYINGDYLLINKFDKNFKRGDVVIFENPKDTNQLFVRRIIGLPQEKVDIQNGNVVINGQVLNENYISGDTSGDTSIIINQDEYFVLGDNRNNSSDSRIWGRITKASIQGKIFYKVSGFAK